MATTKRGEPGTVSHGTMRDVDLIPRFWDELDCLNRDRALELKLQYPLLGDEDWIEGEGREAAGYLLEELFDALDDCAPIGFHFSAHEGDGSDFGFWADDEQDDDEDEDEDRDLDPESR